MASNDPNFLVRNDDAHSWRPDDSTVAMLESRLTVPDRMGGPLANFDRYYTGVYRNGHQVVVVELVNLLAHRSNPASVHVVKPSEVPAIGDGGCGVITASYDLVTKQLSDAVCNFAVPSAAAAEIGLHGARVSSARACNSPPRTSARARLTN